MDFQCINIRQVPREVLKTAASGLGFQHLPQDLANVNAWKTMFDPYIYVRNSSLDTWKNHFNDWSVVQQTLICAKMVSKSLPAIKPLEEEKRVLLQDTNA